VPLRPIIAGIQSGTTKISKYLDSLLRPIFDKATDEYTLQNSLDFISKLKQYEITERSLLITFDISDLYTVIPQESAVQALLT
ncbi:unnamed protein product, partial [Didymodactylos carnosus]